ncbi:MAG: hypothetical protein ABW185_13060 [Sedimenticola sp.]
MGRNIPGEEASGELTGQPSPCDRTNVNATELVSPVNVTQSCARGVHDIAARLTVCNTMSAMEQHESKDLDSSWSGEVGLLLPWEAGAAASWERELFM